MARVLLVRHGESEWNEVGRWQGRADPPLTPLGRQQAKTAAAALGQVDAVVSSTLSRARETAEIISAELGIGPVLELSDLIERDAGEWSGLTRAEIEERYPGYLSEGRRPAGWELDDSVAQRVLGALDALHVTFGDGEVLCLTHGGVIMQIERHFGEQVHRIANLGGRWVDVGGDGLRLGPRVDLLNGVDLTDGATVTDQV